MDFNILNYGAVGDGKVLNTTYIQSAIDACAKSGGGRVIISQGVYLTGTIILKQNVNLHIEKDGVLLASPREEDFPEFEKYHVDVNKLSRFQGASMIYAEECENVSITGEGKIDGNGYSYVTECEPYHAGWRYRRNSETTLPRLVFLVGCKNVTISDVTVENAPAGWAYWIHDCDYVNFNKVKILCSLEFPNNDGIHVNSCRDVKITNSTIFSGDDSIVIRAANRSLKQRKITERVTVDNCYLKSHTNAVRIGWVGDGVIRNCTLSNIQIDETRTGITITLPGFNGYFTDNTSATSLNGEAKADISKKATDEDLEHTLIEDITFTNIEMKNIYLRPIQIEIQTSEYTWCEAIRNVNFNGVKAQALSFPMIVGREDANIENINFTDCEFNKVKKEDLTYYFEPILTQLKPLTIKFAKNVKFNNVIFSGEE